MKNYPNPPLRILIVEDEALLAMDLAAIIEDAGHLVEAEAATLSEVEALAGSIDPHIAFVDLQLADKSSGIDVCAEILRNWPAATIIFVTANPKKLPEDFAGGHGVISKPFSRMGMLSTLNYLEEGVCRPPPVSTLPAEFTPAPHLMASWAQ